MTTVRRFRNKYRLQVRERDHHPPHVHLCGFGIDVVIDLATLTSEGDWPRGVKAEVETWVAEHRDELLEMWKRWHP